MCYFSAQGHSRAARADEVLVVKQQAHGTKWLVSPDDCGTAVCLRNGTQLELLFIPKQTRDEFGLPRETKATFRERWGPRQLHDALVFKSGRCISLQRLLDGQVVKLAWLP